jgi:hypothetical protein
MVIHTAFSFTHVRPRKKENRRLGIGKTVVRFSGGQDYHKRELRDDGRTEKMKLENGKGKMGREKFGLDLRPGVSDR